jgi:tetratricopeptide (TPR) repeat protein
MAGRSETSERLCEEARRAKDRGDTHAAENLLASAVDRNPGDAEMRLELSEMLLADGNAPGASEHLKILVDQLPDDPRCLIGLAEAMYLEHRMLEAAGLVEQALDLDPRNGRGILLRGKIEQAQGDHVRALEDYYRVLATEPEHAEAKLLAAGLQSKQGDSRLAAQLLRSIIDASDAANPYREKAYWLLGECYARDARWPDAARALARGIASRPGLAPDWNELANACWRSGDLRGASQALERALSADPTNRDALALHAALDQQTRSSGTIPASTITRTSHAESPAVAPERPQIRPGP